MVCRRFSCAARCLSRSYPTRQKKGSLPRLAERAKDAALSEQGEDAVMIRHTAQSHHVMLDLPLSLLDWASSSLSLLSLSEPAAPPVQAIPPRFGIPPFLSVAQLLHTFVLVIMPALMRVTTVGPACCAVFC